MRTKTWIVLLLSLLAFAVKAAVVPIKFTDYPRTNTVPPAGIFLIAITNAVENTNYHVIYSNLFHQITSSIPVSSTIYTNSVISNFFGSGGSLWTNIAGLLQPLNSGTNTLKVQTNNNRGIIIGDTNRAFNFFGWPADNLTFINVMDGSPGHTVNQIFPVAAVDSTGSGAYEGFFTQSGANPIFSHSSVAVTNAVIATQLDEVAQKGGGYILLRDVGSTNFVGLQNAGQLSTAIGPNHIRIYSHSGEKMILGTNGAVSFFNNHTNYGVLYAKSNFFVSGTTLLNGTFIAGDTALFLKGLASLGITNTIGFQSLGRISLGDRSSDLTTSSNTFRQYGPMHIHDLLYFQNVAIDPGNLLYVTAGRSAATVPGVNSTTAGYLAGVTSLIQPQLNGKQIGSLALTNLAGNPNVVTQIFGAGTVTVSSNVGIVTITGSGGAGGGLSLWTNVTDHSVLRTVAGSTNFIGGGNLNVIGTNNTYATVSGGTSNIISADSSFSVIGGGLENVIATNNPGAVIAGGTNNSVLASAQNSAIGGGSGNVIDDPQSTIGGGFGNSIVGTNTTIGGGYGNRAVLGNSSGGVAIGGGEANLAADAYVTIAGGIVNSAYSPYSVIGGGGTNTIFGATLEGWETIAGGVGNTMYGSQFATIGGGAGNVVATAALGSTIAGGRSNYVQSGVGSDLSAYNFLGGGYSNGVVYPSSFSVIGGGEQNTMRSWHGVIGGGYLNTIYTNATYGVIGGGRQNSISNDSTYATVTGGWQNKIQDSASYSAILGGSNNIVTRHSTLSVIGGGINNLINTNADWASILGGFENTVGSGANNGVLPSHYGFIGGGRRNVVNSPFAVIGGGEDNIIEGDPTRAGYQTIAGGHGNNIGQDGVSLNFAAYDATIGGGSGNNIHYGAEGGTIAGGVANVIRAGNTNAVISGGYLNTIINAPYGVILGGEKNILGSTSPSHTAERGFIIGSGITHTNPYTVAIGYTNNALIIVSKTNLHLTGGMQLQMTNDAGEGKVLTSDSLGRGRWAAGGSGGGSGSMTNVTNSVWVDAGAMRATHGSTAEGGLVGATTGTWTNAISIWDTWDFDDTTNECVQFRTTLDRTFTGPVYVDLHWVSTNTLNGASNVVWNITMTPLATNNLAGSWIYQTNLTTRFWSSNSLQIASMPTITLTNYSPRHLIDFRISRYGTNTADAALGDARLVGAQISYITSQ